MIKTLITPEEISTLARPCYADEEKALAYIVEAEQNNIKPAIGDDLYIQLKEGGQTFLLEGGVYERNGKRYYLNGIKKALAYFVISRLYESSTTELTRQGVVIRRSEFSDNADERDIISVSRETYAIANRYMEEIERYLGTDVKNTSQRVHFDLIGGGSKTQRQSRPSSSSGGASPSSPANINVVQTLGNSDKDVISQAGVTREFNAVRIEADEKLTEAKAYTDEEIAKAVIGGSDIDLSDYAKKEYVDDEVQKAKDYTDEKFNSINIPTELSELSDDAEHRLVTDDEKKTWDNKSDFNGDYNDLENKPTIPSLDGYATEDYVMTQVGDVNEVLEAIINGEDTNPTAKKKAVTFYDYDGTIRYSYTAEEFLALTEMPPLPRQQGLICQEWNWSYEDAMEYVAEYGVLDVGATYITDDGKTRLYIRIAAEGRMDVLLYFNQTVANGVTIDWGDGSATETLSGTGNKNTTHRYASVGDYCINLDVADGCTLGLGHGTSSYCVMGPTGNKGKVYCNMLQRCEIGNGVTKIENYAFYSCNSLSAIAIPNSVTSIGSNALRYCYSLSAIAIPNSVTSIGSNALNSCYSLSAIAIPNSVTSIGSYAFQSCYSLSAIAIPDGVTSIGSGALNECPSLSAVTIPDGVTSIGSGALASCFGMAYFDFSHLTAVPTLANTDAFQNIPSDCKIIVPDNLYDTWIAATNWSAYATYTIKKSDWDNLKQGGLL